MQKSCRVSFMFGELTDKETMSKNIFLLDNFCFSFIINYVFIWFKQTFLIVNKIYNLGYWSFFIIGRIDEAVETYTQDQFEILLYKKNSKLNSRIFISISSSTLI